MRNNGLRAVAMLGFIGSVSMGLIHCESDDTPRTLSITAGDAAEEGKAAEGGEGGAEGSSPSEASAPTEASVESGSPDTSLPVAEGGGAESGASEAGAGD